MEPQFIHGRRSRTLGLGLAPRASDDLIIDQRAARVAAKHPLPPGDNLFVEAISDRGLRRDRRGQLSTAVAGLARDNVAGVRSRPAGRQRQRFVARVRGPVSPCRSTASRIRRQQDLCSDPPAANMLGPIDQLTCRRGPHAALHPPRAGRGRQRHTFAGPVPAAPPRTLTIDGLWIGIEPFGLAEQNLALETDDARRSRRASSSTASSTASRSGARRSIPAASARASIRWSVCRYLVALEVRGQVEELIIDRAIVGPVREASGAGDPARLAGSQSATRSSRT